MIKLSDYIKMLQVIEKENGGDAVVLCWYDSYELEAEPPRFQKGGERYSGEKYPPSVVLFDS